MLNCYDVFAVGRHLQCSHFLLTKVQHMYLSFLLSMRCHRYDSDKVKAGLPLRDLDNWLFGTHLSNDYAETY